MFRCPVKAVLVQAEAEEDSSSPDGRHVYKPIQCLACGRIHLVNPATGKLQSEELSKR